MATLQDTVEELQALVRALDDVRTAPEYAPEKTSSYPAAFAFVESGWYERRKEKLLGNHSVIIEVHVARKDLARDISTAMGLAKSVPDAIMDAWRTGSLNTLSHLGRITYTFGAMSWADTDTVGFRFTVSDVRTEDDLT